MSFCCPVHEDVMLTYRPSDRNKGQWICEVCEKHQRSRLNRLFPMASGYPEPKDVA